MTNPNPPLSDYSTQAAREAEQHRRKLRREFLADVTRTLDALSADSINAVTRISAVEWARAQAQGETQGDANAA